MKDLETIFRRHRLACDGMVLCPVDDWNAIVSHTCDMKAINVEMYAMLEMVLPEMHGLIDEVNDQRMSRINSQMQTPPELHDGQTLHEIQMLLVKVRGEDL